MDVLSKLTGILSEIFLFCVFLYCKKKKKDFNYHLQPVSHLGTSGKIGKIFNAGLLIYTVLRFIFLSSILTFFSLWNNFLILLSLTIAFPSIIITAIVSLERHRKIHGISGFMIFAFSVIFIWDLGLELLKYSYFLGMSNLIIGGSMLVGSLMLILWKKINSYFEFYIFFLVILWDVLMTLVIFRII